MKKILLGLLVFCVAVFASAKSFALDKTFVISATVPAATSVGINAFSVKGTPPVFTAVTGTTLNFSPMTLNPAIGIYLPDHFFAIDVVSSGGAGSPSAVVTYTEGANPNNPAHGLGWKSTATFMKVVFVGPNPTDTTESPISAHGPKKLLKDVHGETIASTETAGGWLRVYLGIVTKDATAPIPDPTAGEVFSNADKAGSYDGTLLISATAT